MIKRLRNFLLSELLCALVEDDIISKDRQGNIFLGQEKLTESEIRAIGQEIKFLKETRVWNIINETIKRDAMDKMFKNAKTTDDMFAGKMMLYNLDLTNKIINILLKG